MTVKAIKFVEEVDNTPEYFREYGELRQGDTYNNFLIYELQNDKDDSQFIKISIEHDSYGDSKRVSDVKLVTGVKKTITVWQ